MAEKRTLKTPRHWRLLSLGMAVLLIAACLAAYFLAWNPAIAAIAPPGDGQETGGGEGTGTDFDLSKPFAPRAARDKAGANGVAWEINFGGSGEDEIGGAFQFGDDFYIFGRTNSTDGDFKGRDTGSLFAAVLSGSGELKAVSAFGEERGATFKAVRYNPYNDNFYILCGFPAAAGFAVCAVDGRLAPAGRAVYMKGTQDAPEDLLISAGAVNVFYSRTNQYTGAVNLGLAAFPHDLSQTVYDDTTTVGSFRFVRAFPRGNGFAALVNCDAGGAKYPALAVFDKTKTPALSPLKASASADIFATDIAPADNGYLVFACDRANGYAGSILRVLPGAEGKLICAREKLLNIAPCTDGRFFYRSENSYFVAAYRAGVSLGSLIADGPNELMEVKIPALNGVGTIADHAPAASGASAFLSDTAGISLSARPNIVVTALTAGHARVYQNSFGGGGEDRAVRLFEYGGGYIVFGNTQSRGGDVGDNFGRTDCWAFRVN
jgi:hypothetical protein